MATVLKYTYKTEPGKTFNDIDFVGYVTEDFGDHVNEVSFRLTHFCGLGESYLRINNIQIAEFAGTELVDCEQGRYDVVIESNDYLLFHLIPDDE